MRHLLFALLCLSLFTSCRSEKGTVVEQLFPTDITKDAYLALAMMNDTVLVEVIPDTTKTVPIPSNLFIQPCEVYKTTVDMDEAPRTLIGFTQIECEKLKGPWEAGYVWVLVSHPTKFEWIRVPALLRPNATHLDRVLMSKVNVRTSQDGYGADLLVQQN